MNPKTNTKISNSIDDATARSYTALTGLQSKLDFPTFILIKNKGKSPPGCPRSSGISHWQHPYINRTACKGNNINNKEEIKYNKAKANFIF